MSNSKLVSYTKLSPNCNKPRNAAIKKITYHHVAGNLNVEQIGELFADPNRRASSNYGIGTDGRIALYVAEENRAWTSGSRENDHQAITIEIANDGAGPAWHVSDAALESAIALSVDICKRNGIEKLNFTGGKNGNVTLHKYFQNTTCPGPYLESKIPYIVDQVNIALGHVVNHPSVLEWQKAAMADGFKFPKYGADGKWGAECESVAKDAIVRWRRINYKYPNLTRIVQKVTGANVDGLCGPATETKIKEYQKANGLTVDGIVGLKTWKKILGV